MHVSYPVSGPGLGVADDLTAVKCNLTICYATSPAAEQKLRLLQTTLNRFASLAGSKAIATDTYIGAGTLTLAKKVATFLKAKGFGYSSLDDITSSKTKLATRAPTFTDMMVNAANQLGLPGSSPGSSSPPPSPVTPDTTVVVTPGTDVDTTAAIAAEMAARNAAAKKAAERKWWYIGAATVVAGAAATIVILTTPPKKASVAPAPSKKSAALTRQRRLRYA